MSSPNRPGAHRLDVLSRRYQPIRLHIGQHEVHPRAGQSLGDAEPDAGCGTGHDRGLSGQFQRRPPQSLTGT